MSAARVAKKRKKMEMNRKRERVEKHRRQNNFVLEKTKAEKKILLWLSICTYFCWGSVVALYMQVRGLSNEGRAG